MRAALAALSFVLAFAWGEGVSAWAAAAAPVRLVPHRAVYDLSLARSDSSGRGVEAVRGRIAFDFDGDACDGYTVNYRQVTVMEGGASGSRTLDTRTATFEAGDGRSMRFKTDSRLQGARSRSVDGVAHRAEDGSLAIRLRQPKRASLSIRQEPAFPTEHIRRLIASAQAGENKLALKVYDGSDDGRTVFDTLALIGHRIEPGAGRDLEEAVQQEALSGSARWPVTVSYFSSERGDQTPVYTISFDLYDNGISRNLLLDYGDFALQGELRTLDMRPYPACLKQP
jgi:hypothetical protein